MLGVGPGVGVRYRQETPEFAVAGVLEHVNRVGGFERPESEPLGLQRYPRW